MRYHKFHSDDVFCALLPEVKAGIGKIVEERKDVFVILPTGFGKYRTVASEEAYVISIGNCKNISRLSHGMQLQRFLHCHGRSQC